MIESSTVLAIITARGGSKGLPRKNVLPVAAKPLIAWTVEAARQSRYIDRLILSSEDQEIIDTACACGCEAPFRRPDVLAKDDTPGIEPVLHAITTLKQNYDYIVLLQPTSPLRTTADIDNCIETCIRGGANTCVSVTKVKKSPYWMFSLDEAKRLKPLMIDTPLPTRRQDSPTAYVLNGAVYVARREWLLKEKVFVGKGTVAYVMPEERSLDIDNKADLELAEYYLQRRLANPEH